MVIETYLKEYGFDEKTISKIKKLSLKTKDNKIENNLKYFENLEYSKNSIIKMITKYYNIVNYKLDFLKEKINYFKSLDLNIKEIEKITASKPTILAYELPTLKSKIDSLKKYNFNDQEIKQIIIKMPSILSFNVETLNRKLNTLSKLNVKKVIIHNPKLAFIQNEVLTLARYNYLKEINFEFNDKSIRYLFSDNKKFTTKFKITKEELLKKYP